MVLSGTQVTGNSANEGGGMHVDYGSPVLSNTLVSGNSASYGGGVYLEYDSANLTMDGGQLYDNAASTDGGGLYINAGNIALSGTQVISNSAAEWGGGMYLSVDSAQLNGIQVIGNTAAERGGGLYIGGSGSVVLSDAQIISNTAVNEGGGLYFSSFSEALNINGGQVRDNSAGWWGGGLYVDRGSAVLTGVQVVNNSAAINGGGLYLGSGSAVLSSTQVISNSANHGGGLFVYDSSALLKVYGGEVRGNTVPLQGGGLFINANATLNDVSVSGNSAENGGGMYVNAGSTTLSGTSVDGSATQDGDAVYQDGGTLTSASALTITGQVYQISGAFAASSYDLDIDGDLVLAGGDFYAPDASNTFTLSGDFTHTGGNYHQSQVVTGSGDFGFPKAGGLILNANGLDLDSTTVTLTAGADCAGVPPGEAVQHCYVISPTQMTGRDATLTFFYRDGEIPGGHYCSVMEAYAWDGSWDNLLTRDMTYGNDGRLCGPEPQSIRALGVSSFPTFTLRGPLADLTINKVVTPTQAMPGDAITYTLSFSNVGALTATGVVITDSIPISVTGTSVISSGVVITPRMDTRYVWDVADLAPGAGGVITVTGVLSQPLATGTFTNTVAITTTDTDGNSDNNESSADVTVHNDPPIANDNAYSTGYETTLVVDADNGVLSNDTERGQ